MLVIGHLEIAWPVRNKQRLLLLRQLLSLCTLRIDRELVIGVHTEMGRYDVTYTGETVSSLFS